LSKVRECRCSDLEIKRYQNKLSDTFLDRIDIFVVMQEISVDDVGDISSNDMHTKVIEVFSRQKERGQERLNGKLLENEIDKFCIFEDDAIKILNSAINKFALTHRSIASIKKTSRTIADINSHKLIQKMDLLEALSYRRRK
jgi:magnesium chelatase family protein